CLGFNVKTVMVKTKTSTTDNATLEDLVDPIQVSFNIGFMVSATGENPSCSTGLGTITGTFSGGTPGYECKLDNGAFASCSAPTVTYNNVPAGSHTVTVRESGGCAKTSD